MKLIDLHKRWCESGKIVDRNGCGGTGGLCNAVPVKYLKKLEGFAPEFHKPYWGQRDGNCTFENAIHGYNPLRQTIVLLICAMNNEL